MIPVVAVIFVIVVGGALVYWLYRVVAAEAPQVPPGEDLEEPDKPDAAIEPKAPPTPDGLAYIFCHEYAGPVPESKATSRRSRCVAPMTGEEVEARDVAAQILFAQLAELYMDGSVDLEVRASDPGLMPPFPHKCWEMYVRKRRDFPRTPVADKMANVFLERSTVSRGPARTRDDAICVSELVEKTVAAMRRDTSFWRRAGVYADVRNFVEAHMLERGYLISGDGQTFLERVKGVVPKLNEGSLQTLRDAFAALEARLEQFEERHGVKGESTADDNAYGIHMPLVEGAVEADEVPLCEGLRISVIEALVALRQMEPSDDIGI